MFIKRDLEFLGLLKCEDFYLGGILEQGIKLEVGWSQMDVSLWERRNLLITFLFVVM